jgi:hypothetical protein
LVAATSGPLGFPERGLEEDLKDHRLSLQPRRLLGLTEAFIFGRGRSAFPNLCTNNLNDIFRS